MKYELHLRLDDSDTPEIGHEAFADWTSPVWAEIQLGDWTVGLNIQNRNGRPVLTELRAYPTEPDQRPGQWSRNVDSVPDGGLRPDFIKGLKVGSMRDQAFQALIDPSHPLWDDGWPNPAENHYDTAHYAGIETGAEADVPTRPGRQPLTDEQMAFVAKYYVEAIRGGKSVTDHIKTQLQQHEEYVSDATVAGRVSKARRRGFLSDAQKGGQKGGHLTPKAREVLARLSEEKEQSA
jgi:hypothetical protein